MKLQVQSQHLIPQTLGVVEHAYNPSTQEAKTGSVFCELEASLVNRASSRTSMATLSQKRKKEVGRAEKHTERALSPLNR